MWPFSRRKGSSGFSSSFTAEEVTQGIDGTNLTAIVTGFFFYFTYNSLCSFYFLVQIRAVFSVVL